MRTFLIALLLTSVAFGIPVMRAVRQHTEGPQIEILLPKTRNAIASRTNLSRQPARVQNNNLDEVFCTHDFAPLEEIGAVTISVDSGDAIIFWAQSAGCSQCSTSEPIRIESILPVFVRPDGSPADTLDLEVSLLCAANGVDPCSGIGVLRATRFVSLPFAEDLQNGNAEITIPFIEFVGMLADSNGAFVRVESFGFRGETTALAISLDETNLFPVHECDVWIESDSLIEWNQLIGDSAGGPRVAVGWSCELNDSIVIPACPDSCVFAHINAPQAYFDPFANIIYQWIEPDSVQLPLVPQSLDLKLYFETIGLPTDRAYFRVLFSCAGFGEMCCPPSEPMCSVPLSVVRGSAFQTVLDVHAPFGDVDCCINEPFWLGVVIDSVTGGAARPSFLYSSANIEIDPPLACEQWIGASGNLVSERPDDFAWADFRLSALCGSCGEGEPSICAPSTIDLDCANAVFVACAEAGIFRSNESIPAGIGTAARYCCSDLSYFGRELVYRMQIPNQGNIRIQATTDTLEHVAMFLLETCNTQNCVSFGVDSLSATGLTNGEYLIVVESFVSSGQTVDLVFECIADCNGEMCISDLQGQGGIGNRYLDAEGDGAGTEFFQSYYAGTGNSQTILKFNATTCESLTPIVWQSIENSPSRMLAYDPRNGGEFWCGTTIDYFTGTGRLYRLSSGGGIVQSWTVLSGLPIMRWSGAAFDPTHNHMWVFIRDSSNTGNSRAYEIDLNNPQQPTLIQGPHALPHQSPNQSLSCAGADYAHFANQLLVVHQGAPDDFVQCYEDLDPGYAGPRPGPGFVPVSWCTPDSNSVQGFGIAAIEDSSGGKIAMTNFTDADWTHPLELYPPPCRLSPPRCIAPNDLAIFSNSSVTRLTWTATFPGVYDIYSSLSADNDGNPDGGADTLFNLEASLSLPAGSTQWVDGDTLAAFKAYSIILTCSTGIE